MPTIRPLDVPRVAIVGTYVPRRCGVATFAADLADGLAEEMPAGSELFALAMDDIPEGYRYPQRVRFQIRTTVQGDYRLAAEFIASSQANVVIVQHEFGIYGGPAGAHILPMLRALRVPVLTTLHTVLAEPTAEQRQVMDQLWRVSDRLVVMSHRAESMLEEVYAVPPERVAFIPHGIPDVPFVDPYYFKDQFQVEGRQVILTFGLLNPGKGIEYMIEAMPEVVRHHHNTIYIVLGATHPHAKRQHGEAYRSRLQRRVADLGLQEHVRFHNRFVELDELTAYIGAADLYVTPYLAENQITSGTLAYALGAGKAVVSTPYWYAQEMLAEQRGMLTPFRDPEALAENIVGLFDNDVQRHLMRKRAYTFCRNMVWRQVAREYYRLAQEVVEERAHQPRPALRRKRVGRVEELPELDLRHLLALTDDTGILQHARHTTPDRRHGYCLDDNGRGLVVCALYSKLYRTRELERLAHVYLSYVWHAFNEETGRSRSLMSFERCWLDTVGSEDSHGRALWGLGMMATHATSEGLRDSSVNLFQNAVKATEAFTSPRAWAYSLLGMHAYLEHYGGDAGVRRLRHILADRLHELFRRHAGPDWDWCEPTLTYANGALAHALILAGQWIPNGEMRDQGMRSLRWLCEVQQGDRGQFSPVGNRGWYPRGGVKARFDQQPLEASLMVLACAEAYRATLDEHWLAESRRTLEWFLGRNDLEVPIFDFSSGGCFDGLTPDGPNANRGAESTVAWLIALLTFLGQVERQALAVKGQEEAPHPADTAQAEAVRAGAKAAGRSAGGGA